MAATGLPMYICSTSSIPIVLVLLSKGISPSAAFVFLFAGPATNAASLSVLTKTLGKKTVGVYLAVTAISAVGFGLLLDAIIGWFSLPMPEFGVQTSMHGTSVLKIVTGIIFGAVILRSLASKIIMRINTRKGKNNEEGCKMKIEGMSCQHCVKAVKEAIEKVDGVKSVRVDLEEGLAYIEGENYNEEAVKDAVRNAGYKVK